MSWVLLVLAGFFEVGFTTCMKLSDGFKDWRYALGFFVFAVLSFYFLNKATQNISLGTAYAVWTGIGAAGTVIIGILSFGDSINTWRIFFLSTLILSVIGLKFLGGD
ncbi:multidrug efflux SMR transporter [Leptospira selangorensis]|uniref:Guanidinium exporter n=1 Tax=Leptospira selangorensis TaxID=2484982 RepID=A0A4R9GE64_9LEPT|nr:multidrug efflux SMR transporter [Leptospira selangorensis]TGK09387.1 multidrug efflux SMR transporter [Leptospira selangorensis]TGM16117.1 multidrug efflux SMR transporter [Leptospira selangorensis]TGM17932.1 multidrug efflux SMR transporter [Leptospira selangorensis]